MFTSCYEFKILSKAKISQLKSLSNDLLYFINIIDNEIDVNFHMLKVMQWHTKKFLMKGYR